MVSAFSQVLIEGDFVWSMVKKPSASYDDLLGRAKKYINVEEVQHARKTEPDSIRPGTSRPERKAPPQVPQNVILRPFRNYGSGKQVAEKTIQVLEGEYAQRQPSSYGRRPPAPLPRPFYVFH